MKPAQLNIRVTPEVAAAVDALKTNTHDTASAVARSGLLQFVALQTAELRGLRGAFTLPELQALASTTSGIAHDTLSRQFLAAEVEDAALFGRLDGILTPEESTNLVNKLQALTPGQLVALSTALEKWWAGDFNADDASQPAGFARIGLIASAS